MISAFDWIGDNLGPVSDVDDWLDRQVRRGGRWFGGQFRDIKDRFIDPYVEAYQERPFSSFTGIGHGDTSGGRFQPRPPTGGGMPSTGYTPSGPDRTDQYGFGPRHPSSPAYLEHQRRQAEIADILSQLESMGDPSRYYADPGELEAQARAQVAAQYNPIIQGLIQQRGATRRRGERGQRQVGRMFGALSRNLKGEIPDIQEFYEEEERDFNRGRRRLDRSIDQGYDEIQADQEALLKRLGIEAAAPDVFDDQMADEGFFQELSKEEAQTGREMLGEQRRGDVGFTRRGSQIARMEGRSRQADIANQIMEAMAAYDQQIGSQRAAKSAAYTSALGELQQQMQQDAMQRAQQEFENYIAQIQLGRELQSPIPGTEPPEPPDSIDSPAGIGGYYTGQGLSEESSQKVQDIIMNALSRPEFSYDTQREGQRTKEEMIASLVEANKHRLTPQERSMLIDAAYQVL